MIGFIGDRMKKEHQASILSIETQLKSIFAMVLAPLFGFLADNYGIEWVFFGGAILMFLLVPVVMLRAQNNE